MNVKNLLLSFLELLGMAFLAFIGFIILILLMMCVPQEKYHYEYIDLDNNKGTAEECSYKFEEYRSGGQGSPVCVLYDGTVKQVKEYKWIYDDKVIPIRDLFKNPKENKNE